LNLKRHSLCFAIDRYQRSCAATYTAPASIALTATATDSDGSITQVQFYDGATLLGTATQQGTTSTYIYNWNNVPQGNYTNITAVATDNGSINNTTTSAPIQFTVTPHVAQTYYIHTDHLNTPRLITNAANAKVWEWNNDDPFANNVPNDDPNSTGNHFEFNHGFAGQYRDKETNSYYNYYRDNYFSSEGRYGQSDPIGLGGGINTYAYANLNPLQYSDPLGLWSPEAHNKIITAAFPNLPANLLNQIKDGSNSVDSIPNQLPGIGNAYEHAMTDKGQSAADAKKKMCKFIKQNLDYYNKYKTTRHMYSAYRALGRALHPIMDSTSPMHKDFQRWDLFSPDALNHGPLKYSLEDSDDLSPSQLNDTANLIRDAERGGYCGC
jgi:RHS repeat-associated protein